MKAPAATEVTTSAQDKRNFTRNIIKTAIVSFVAGLVISACTTPAAAHGTISTKPRGPVIETTTTSSGSSPHREAGFRFVQIPGMVRLHSPAMVSGGMGLPARMAARLLACS